MLQHCKIWLNGQMWLLVRFITATSVLCFHFYICMIRLFTLILFIVKMIMQKRRELKLGSRPDLFQNEASYMSMVQPSIFSKSQDTMVRSSLIGNYIIL